jgi:hypothetical protein
MGNSQDKKQALEAKRDELIKRLEAIKQDYRRGLDPDSGERAIQLENADALAEIDRVTREELDRVKKELANLSG